MKCSCSKKVTPASSIAFACAGCKKAHCSNDCRALHTCTLIESIRATQVLDLAKKLQSEKAISKKLEPI
jgi:hypothetical protein